MAMHHNYWACSAFADWLRGTVKRGAKTSKQWDQWHKEAKEKHPIRYWIVEEGLDRLQDLITWPERRLYDVKYYVLNRWVTRTHALTSNLKKGQWYEFETRLMHSMFDELVNYVEIEEAWSNISWDKEAREKYNAPWHALGWFRWRTWRCPEAGIDKLEWASKLTNEDWLEEDSKHLAEPTGQAIAAKEILELYHWWKNIRPNRLDPYEASGWSELCNRDRKEGRKLLDLEDRSETERLEKTAALDRCRQLEEQYDQEDTDMMIRLVRIRRNLWT